jgi:hypothetical protein
MKIDASREDLVGAAMVVGGGIAGIQAAMDLADAGFYYGRSGQDLSNQRLCHLNTRAQVGRGRSVS